MKILYAVQGTGNGHIARACDIIPALESQGELDILVSGTQSDIDLPFDVKYRLRGLSFIFGKNGGVDLPGTFRNANLTGLWKEIHALPVENYDLVINDFEPVSAWSALLKGVSVIGLSHQAAIISKGVPRPATFELTGELVLRIYAPCKIKYGFHFQQYNENIFTPVVRQAVRKAENIDKGHYTVYLPSYSTSAIISRLSQFPDVQWEIFSKHFDRPFVDKNFTVKPVDNEAFIKSMASCCGILCGAGFETPAEALFLGKKLMVIPMVNQREQHYNAAALRAAGVPVINKLKGGANLEKIAKWIEAPVSNIKIEYPDVTRQLLERIVQKHKPLTNQKKKRKSGIITICAGRFNSFVPSVLK